MKIIRIPDPLTLVKIEGGGIFTPMFVGFALILRNGKSWNACIL